MVAEARNVSGHGVRARPDFNKRRVAISQKIQRCPDWMSRPRSKHWPKPPCAYQNIIVGTIVGTDMEEISK